MLKISHASNSIRVLALDDPPARQALKSSLLLHSESSTSAAAEEIGRQLLTYGRRIPRAELFARIDAVDPATVKAGGLLRASTRSTDVESPPHLPPPPAPPPRPPPRVCVSLHPEGKSCTKLG